ncbi:hypothetical protein CWRG_02156 [Chthonomonas calidirosea]|uniref:hypothetical protein n=1 Tax=Chthonomonas calidirosea TaxID=454171 RepID=UPI0006DD3F2C|nr:hypothetical protein [Chthonomonas calidirosea]CEK18406.1 hypothetical protein CWRG_02156 [Chthonomonas calidirosea]
MTQAIQIVAFLLLLALLFVAYRLWDLLGTLKRTIQGLEETRHQITVVVERANGVVDQVDAMLKERIEPTLHTAQEAVEHVQSATRSVAESAASLRLMVARAEASASVGRLLAAGGTLAGALLQRRRQAAETTKPEEGKSRKPKRRWILGK